MDFYLRLQDFEKGAAEVGSFTDTTSQPTPYHHPDNPNITFWDLPGIGTDGFPPDTYCEQVALKNYDTFLIFTETRFRKDVSFLVETISSIDKKFFFVRSKIDQDVRNQKSSKAPGSFCEADMLAKMRLESLKTLGDRLRNKQHVFLISNTYPEKWDFKHLTLAILDVLPTDLRECLTLSLGVLKSLSTETLARKVEVLEGRTRLVALASAAAALVPIPGVSAAADISMIYKELEFYRFQLGLPKLGSDEFKKLTGATQAKVKICLSILELAAKGATWLAAYASETAAEEAVRLILPGLGLVIASAMSVGATYMALTDCLKKMEEAAFAVLHEAVEKSARDLP